MKTSPFSRACAVILACSLILLGAPTSFADGKGYKQADSMGAGPAPIPSLPTSPEVTADVETPPVATAAEEAPLPVFRVFLLAGQSNMTGHGSARELDPPYNQKHERIRIWANGRWEYFVPKRNFGPGVAMAHQLADFWPNDTIGIIKVAISGTGISSFQPDWTREAANRTMDGHKGNLYQDMVQAVTAARQVSTFELSGFVWKQGGKDMRSKELGDEYLANFEKMLTSLRTDLQAPQLPAFIATYLTPEELETFDAPLKLTRPGMTAVIKAHLDAATAIPNVVTFSHGKLPCRVDGIHFNTEGQLRLGIMYANAIARFYAADSATETEDETPNQEQKESDRPTVSFPEITE